jgi:hypothetical protein
VCGAPEINCVGGTGLAIFSAISMMVNTPRLSSPTEPTECVLRTLPEFYRNPAGEINLHPGMGFAKETGGGRQ